MRDDRRRRVVLVALGAGFLVLVAGVVVWAVIDRVNRGNGTVQIAGLRDCSSGMSNDVEDAVERALYRYVEAGVGGAELRKSYDGVVRSGSCENVAASGEVAGRTELIVDVAAVKQSWRVGYYWLEQGAVWRDLGEVEVSCVAASERIYGDWGCESLAIVAVPEADPLMDVLPYFDEQESGGTRFTLWARPKDEWTIDYVEVNLNTCVAEVMAIYKRVALAKLAELQAEAGDEKEYRVVYTDPCGE